MAYILALRDDGSPPTEFMIWPSGWVETSKGRFLFDAKAAESVMADFAKHGNLQPAPGGGTWAASPPNAGAPGAHGAANTARITPAGDPARAQSSRPRACLGRAFVARGAPMQLRVSEVFASVQGEGASLGEPCVFLRLALCNLRCTWCDTKYTWDFSQYRYQDEVRHLSLSEVRAELEGARLGELARLVITGGEPLIQSAGIEALLAELPRSVVVEVETNGTFAPSEALAARIDQWNVSPKLAHGGDPVERRIRPEALAALRATGRAWLKLVVTSASDVSELSLLAQGWPAQRVLLMPEATSREELRARLPEVQALATELGFGASTRLHIERWGGRRGV